MDFFYLFVLFIFGILFGSFFNVVGLRVPMKVPFTNDRSYCPTCSNQLRWYELIPVVSFLIQRGKCRNCDSRISPLYPLIELMTGLLFAYSYIKIGFHLELITAIILMSMLMIIFVSDMAYMLIPNKILLFFLPLFVLMRVIVPLEPWYNSLIGGAAAYLLIAIIIIASKGGMGAGDMKLLGVLGIVLGLGKVLLTFFIAALLGAIIGGILMFMKKIDKKQSIPFGPYIVVAAIISYFFGHEIIQKYMSLL